MSDYTISIFGNKIFSEILNEIKLFSKFKIDFHENLGSITKLLEKINYVKKTKKIPSSS